MEAPNVRNPVLPAGETSVRPMADKLLQAQEDVVRKFASALGKLQKESTAALVGPTDLLVSLFSETISDQDVVLKIPSFDVKLSDGANGESALPEVGATATTTTISMNSPETSPSPEDEIPEDSANKPTMSASVLTTATQNAADLEQRAAQSIGTETAWTKSTVQYAKVAVVTNISESFNHLTDSRLRAWTLLLLRHSLSTGDQGSRKRLLGILQASLKVSSTCTNFKTLPMPVTFSSRTSPDTIILPLLFQTKMEISLKDKVEVVMLRTPGTISGTFVDGTKPTGLKCVKVELDGGKFLSAMVEQVRILVLRAVATATKTSVPLSSAESKPHTNTPTDTTQSQPDHAQKGLVGFRSALNLSPKATAQNHSLLKARSSALRLNGVLHGEKTKNPVDSSPLGLRKNRSVHWDSPAQIPSIAPGSALAPQPKKSRRVQTAAKLKSFKSFGRPHGGDFGSGPRNATFGEFSRAQMWGRDNRMAHHPMPMQQQASMLSAAEEPTPSRNATFGVPSSVRLQSTFASTSSAPSSSMPRSATVLENILLKRASGK